MTAAGAGTQCHLRADRIKEILQEVRNVEIQLQCAILHALSSSGAIVEYDCSMCSSWNRLVYVIIGSGLNELLSCVRV